MPSDDRTDLSMFTMDPREWGPEDMKRLGFQRLSRGDAIRAFCVQCVGTVHEVRKCENGSCPLWIFRSGNDPFREQRELTDEQKQAGADRLRLAREARGNRSEVSLFGDD
jgi:hypothetical protein